MINLELPRKLKAQANQAHQVAAEIFRPISRKYDLAEHEYPVELDTMAAMVEGMSDAGGEIGGAAGGRDKNSEDAPKPSKPRMPTAATWLPWSMSSKRAGAMSA